MPAFLMCVAEAGEGFRERSRVFKGRDPAALLGATLAALVWANSPWGATYGEFWSTQLNINRRLAPRGHRRFRG